MQTMGLFRPIPTTKERWHYVGQKVHPVGLRLGINRTWESKWYSKKKQYADFLLEDIHIRTLIHDYFRKQNPPKDAAVSRVEIERAATKVNIGIHTAKPGIIIGRGGRDVEDLRLHIQKRIGKDINVSVVEVKIPELDAQLVAESVANQMERRIAFRRAMRQAMTRTMKNEKALGIKIRCCGRLGGSEMARVEETKDGKIPLHTLRADIDFGFTEAGTTAGNIGVKIWIYKGDILPPKALRALDQAKMRAEEEKRLAAAEQAETEAAAMAEAAALAQAEEAAEAEEAVGTGATPPLPPELQALQDLPPEWEFPARSRSVQAANVVANSEDNSMSEPAKQEGR